MIQEHLSNFAKKYSAKEILTKLKVHPLLFLRNSFTPTQEPSEPEQPTQLELTAQEIAHDKGRFAWYDQWYASLHSYIYDFSTEELQIPENQRKQSIANNLQYLSDKIVFALREERLDGAGKPLILCIDEYSDGEVLGEESTPAEVQHAFLKVLPAPMSHSWVEVRRISDYQSLNDPLLYEYDYYYVAAVTVAVLAAGMSLAESKTSVQAAIIENLKVKFEPDSVHDQLIQDFLNQFQAETHHPVKEAAHLGMKDLIGEMVEGRVALNLGGEMEQVEGTTGTLVDADSLPYVKAFLDTVHKGRQEMIQFARQFAYDHLDVKPGAIEGFSPPDWWTEQKIRGLHSHAILAYAPNEWIRKSTEVAVAENFDPKSLFNSVLAAEKKEPVFVEMLKEIGEDQGGWYLLRLSNNEPPFIVALDRLTS